MSTSTYKLNGDTLFLADIRSGAVSEIVYKSILAATYSGGFGDDVSDVQQAVKKVEDLYKKTKGVGYHYQLILSEIESNSDINIYINNKSVFSVYPNKHFENDIIIYELESFLFQVKSSLDILVQLLAYKYPYLTGFNPAKISKLSFKSKDRIAGKETINKFVRNGRNDIGDIFDAEVKEWIQDLVTWRDTITHRSDLQGFYCFILRNPKEGEFVLQMPIMPSGREVTEYCKVTLEKLLNLETTIIEKFLLNTTTG